MPEGDLLWEPSAEQKERSRLAHYMRWLADTHGLGFHDYETLWRWSVDDVEGFWGSLWEYFDVRSSRPYERVLGRREMPGAEWFPGAELDYVSWESGAATGWPHTCRTCPRRWPPSSRAPASARSGRAARLSSACQRSSTGSRRSSRRSCSRSTATATAARTSIALNAWASWSR